MYETCVFAAAYAAVIDYLLLSTTSCDTPFDTVADLHMIAGQATARYQPGAVIKLISSV